MTWGQKRGGRAGKAPMPEARWSDLAVAAAAADKPSSGSANPILTGPQAARRSAHKVHTSPELEGRGVILSSLLVRTNFRWHTFSSYLPTPLVQP